MVNIDKQGWHMREHHNTKAIDSNDGSRPHSAECSQEQIKSPMSNATANNTGANHATNVPD